MSDLTPAQRIEAAIVRLEELKGMSTPGSWFLTYELSRWPRVWGNEGDGDADSVAQTEGGGNAELIVTLHATIDPILELLKIEIDYARAKGGIVDELFLPLADAIISWGTE